MLIKINVLTTTLGCYIQTRVSVIYCFSSCFPGIHGLCHLDSHCPVIFRWSNRLPHGTAQNFFYHPCHNPNRFLLGAFSFWFSQSPSQCSVFKLDILGKECCAVWWFCNLFARLHVCTTVFLNFFSEAEPFAAVLIAHRSHVFWGTPEAQRAEIRGQRPRADSWQGQRALSPPASGLGEHCKLS